MTCYVGNHYEEFPGQHSIDKLPLPVYLEKTTFQSHVVLQCVRCGGNHASFIKCSGPEVVPSNPNHHPVA